MVSKFGAQPFLSSITKKWLANQHAIEKSNASPAETVRDPVVTSPRSIAIQTRDDMSFLRVPENTDLQTQRLPRRDSGSEMFQWRELDYSNRSSSNNLDTFLFSEEQHMKSVYFGQKPSFTKSSIGKRLKQDNRKILNGYLRHLATELETKNLVLNKRGTCYFYIDKFLLQLEVPKDGDSFTISTVVHRRLPGNDGHDSDDASQDSTQYSIPEDKEVQRILPKEMCLRLRRKNQIVLCSSQRIAFSYENFAQDLVNFVNVASEMKSHFKSELAWTHF